MKVIFYSKGDWVDYYWDWRYNNNETGFFESPNYGQHKAENENITNQFVCTGEETINKTAGNRALNNDALTSSSLCYYCYSYRGQRPAGNVSLFTQFHFIWATCI